MKIMWKLGMLSGRKAEKEPKAAGREGEGNGRRERQRNRRK